jgi:hypothetical protein
VIICQRNINLICISGLSFPCVQLGPESLPLHPSWCSVGLRNTGKELCGLPILVLVCLL